MKKPRASVGAREADARPRSPARGAGPRAKAEDAPFAAVQSLVRKIPRGKVATYGQLSLLVDRRLTPVGVGWAIRAAPEGSIPWHRVVNARGGISTDPHHPGLQRDMLESEGVPFNPEGNIDLGRFQWKPRPKR